MTEADWSYQTHSVAYRAHGEQVYMISIDEPESRPMTDAEFEKARALVGDPIRVGAYRVE